MNSIAAPRLLAGALLLVAATTAHAQALAPAGSPDSIIASRGGVSLTLGEVDAKIRSMPKDMRPGYLTEADRVARLLDTMLLTKQMAVAAEQQGLANRPEFPADLEMVRQELLARQLAEVNIDSKPLPDFEPLAKEQYLASPEKYMSSGRIDFRHVLIDTDGKDEETAKKTAEEVYKRAKAGEDFAGLVMEFSDEKSKDTRQGLIEDANLTRLDPEFAKQLGQLHKVGDISTPVRSRFGYHVIRLERLERGQAVPFDSVKHEIVKELRDQWYNSEKSRYLSSFSQQHTELNNELIKQLPTRYITEK